MDTELLRTFVTVSECHGFSAAAKVLHRTQSAVSLQIKRLEDQMGESLLQRTRRSVSLTIAGSRLLPYARQILKLEDEARQELGADQQGELIRLGITEEQASAYLPILLPRFASRFPTARIEVSCGVSTQLVDQFQEGLLDVVLCIRHLPTQTGQLLGKESLIWVVSEGCSIEQWPVLPLALNPEGCVFRAHAVAALGHARYRWHVRYTSYSPAGVNLPVENGLAMTIKTPRSMPRGCMEVPASAGLPPLGQVEVEIHRSPSHSSEAYVAFCTMLEALVSDAESVDTLKPASANSSGSGAD